MVPSFHSASPRPRVPPSPRLRVPPSFLPDAQRLRWADLWAVETDFAPRRRAKRHGRRRQCAVWVHPWPPGHKLAAVRAGDKAGFS